MSDAFARLRPSIHGRRFGLTSTPGELLVDGQSILAGGNVPGTKWYVRPGTGSDTNDGRSPSSAFKTLAKAQAVATANVHDMVYLIAESNTAGSTTDYQTATLIWAKDMVHLIGINAGSAWSSRSRIAQNASTTGLTALMQVTANGCFISGVEIFQGVADATSLRALDVTGQRNVFSRCHIAGIGNATQVTAGAMSLYLNAAQENDFDDCIIGVDTISRDNTVTEMKCDAAAVRNRFRRCVFDSYLSNAGFAHVTIGTNGIDRELIFDDCLFLAKSSNKSIQQTSVFSIPAISQGAIILKGGTAAMSDGGAPNWDSNSRGIVFNAAVAAAASAAGGYMTNK